MPATGDPGRRDADVITVLAVVLTLGTGATDVASFTRLGNVFTSVMTGNLVLLGLAIGKLSGALATHAVVAFVAYVAGVAAGARLVPAGQAPGSWATGPGQCDGSAYGPGRRVSHRQNDRRCGRAPSWLPSSTPDTSTRSVSGTSAPQGARTRT